MARVFFASIFLAMPFLMRKSMALFNFYENGGIP